MLPKPRSPQCSSREKGASSALRALRRQLLGFQHPLVWGTAAVLLLSGWFLLEYGQSNAVSPSGSSEVNSARRRNPLLSPTSNADSYTGGGLPGLPPLPGEAGAQTPIDPARLAQPQTQTQSGSRTRSASQATPQASNSLSRDLYNPAGIPLPRAWETQSAPVPLPQGFAASPTAETNSEPASPLQSALDRLSPAGEGASGISQPSRSTDRSTPEPSSPYGTSGIGEAGAIGVGQSGSALPMPQSGGSMPRSTGYQLPPAFRTPGNTSPFSSSAPGSSGQPDGSSPSLSPSVPQSSSGQGTRSSAPYGAIGGGEINTFSNP